RVPTSSALVLKPRPKTALQVALSAEGLKALGTPSEVVNQFSAEFLSGMAGEASRSRRLGDLGDNAPTNWAWGGPDQVPHLLIMFFAEPGLLVNWVGSAKGQHWESAFELMRELVSSDLHGYEPFGFRD